VAGEAIAGNEEKSVVVVVEIEDKVEGAFPWRVEAEEVGEAGGMPPFEGEIEGEVDVVVEAEEAPVVKDDAREGFARGGAEGEEEGEEGRYGFQAVHG
jgi:hypothetical protein